MQVDDYLSLEASVAQPGEGNYEEESTLSEPPYHAIVLTLSVLGDSDQEFIRDDETIDETIDDPSVFLRRGRPLEDDESSEDLEQIAANINARYSRKRPQHQLNDNMITEQIVASMYCFSVPVGVMLHRLRLII